MLFEIILCYTFNGIGPLVQTIHGTVKRKIEMTQKKSFLLLILVLAALAGATGYIIYKYAICPVPEKRMPELEEIIEITFNNYPDNTIVILNKGLVRIAHTRKNVTIRGVKDVKILTTDGSMVKSFTAKELGGVHTMNINKNAETGEYDVEVK